MRRWLLRELRRRLRRWASRRGAAEAGSVAALFDRMLEQVGFDPQSPGWTPGLIELHRHSVARRLQLVPEHFYTPVYSPAALPDSVWDGRFDAGVSYDVDRQLAFLEGVMRYAEELERLPWAGPDADEDVRGFFWSNPQFGHQDAALYYSLLRDLRPRRVIEVGGGFSTLLASEAMRRAGAGVVDCIEPYPRAFLERLPGVNLIRRPVQELPLELFTALSEGDVLFLDGSHVCKTGSDVNHVLLRILPRLAAGVLVHVHDVFLPYEYPRAWAQEMLLYWNEQYLVAALMAHSGKFELLAAHHFLWRTASERLRPLLPKLAGVEPGGTSYWIRSRV